MQGLVFARQQICFVDGMNAEARQLIDRLGLVPLPHEGGYYRPTWTSRESLPSGRRAASAIYFLMAPGEFSALHRMPAEELWHFHAGDAVDHVQLDQRTGAAHVHRLGADVLAGDVPQLVVAGGMWQGAKLIDGGRHGWALFGCTVTPAWLDSEFELGASADLLRDFPKHVRWVHELTR